jgi:hypothetical protein
MLYNLCLAKQPLVHAHLLQTPISSTNEVAFGVSIGPCSLTQVISIVANVTSLSLDFAMLSVSMIYHVVLESF